jgi:LysM repeat protein
MLAGTGIVVLLAGSAAQAGGSDGPEHRAPERRTVHSYVVHPGDTLWGIASRLVGPEGDPRPVMDDLARRNGVDGTLAVGTRLSLPA